jgi:imidazolonepropionase-like amidohydrolase
MRREDRIVGIASEYVKAGTPLVSLNTDSPVVPEEEFFLQGTVSARLGAEPIEMLRALTANPALAFGVGDRVGSLAPGKDADVVLSSGDPLDPRSRIELVLIDGRVQYSLREDGPVF